MKYTAPPYMHDVLPLPPAREPWLHTAKWRAVENIFRHTCRLYGYREIRTPVMEPTELFTRSIGEGTDIVTKEMFTFTDRGGRSMTLRPEGTAPALRAYVEHKLYGIANPVKLYYIETIYRYERGQKGRYREHQQTGVEALGSDAPAMDAEVISLAMEFYRRLGLTGTELRLNSLGCPACRPNFRHALIEYARPRVEHMSDENRMRFQVNPLRMLDSKDERDREILAHAPKLLDYLCGACAEHFAALRRLLDGLGIPYSLDAHLVRGFDYYTRTAFEIVSPGLGAQNSIGGGGRYDGLVEEIGGPPTPGIGFGIGTERCLLAMEQLGVSIPEEDEAPEVFLVSLGEAAQERAVLIAQDLRRAGIAAELDYQARSLKAQMRAADRAGARFAVVLGDEELARSCAGVKPLRGGGEQCTVPLADLPEYLRTH
ncbi:MAG: histidine--tRNA ligase [Chthonomonadales bacterium]